LKAHLSISIPISIYLFNLTRTKTLGEQSSESSQYNITQLARALRSGVRVRVRVRVKVRVGVRARARVRARVRARA